MLSLILTYKYLILIPLSVIEGPIVTVVAGFLVTLKVFNPVYVYLIMVVGDIVGDAIIYYIGRAGKKLLPFFKVTDEKLYKAEMYFADNHHKAIVMSKLIHGLGFTGLVAAGALKVPYAKYFKTCAIISVVQSFVMLILGIFFGHAYLQIGKYLNYYAAIVSVLALGLVLILLVRKYKIGTKTSL